ncbi:MAG: hypothetical protein ACKVWR_14660 [Acidimicrobiales bacterium]
MTEDQTNQTTNGTEPIREPENSTVDDWFGQRVQRDDELIDELLDETGGDVTEAERRFRERSTEAEEHHAQHEQG